MNDVTKVMRTVRSQQSQQATPSQFCVLKAAWLRAQKEGGGDFSTKSALFRDLQKQVLLQN